MNKIFQNVCLVVTGRIVKMNVTVEIRMRLAMQLMEHVIRDVILIGQGQTVNVRCLPIKLYLTFTQHVFT